MRPEYQGKTKDDAVKLRRIVFLVAASCRLLWLSTSVQAAPPLVDESWLHAHLEDANLHVVDMATAPRDYRSGHIPGAVYLSVDDARIKVPAGTYFVLRLLGYPRLVGYDRSWSEWGNRDDLPLAR